MAKDKEDLTKMRAAAVANPDVHPARPRRQRQAAQDAALQKAAQDAALQKAAQETASETLSSPSPTLQEDRSQAHEDEEAPPALELSAITKTYGKGEHAMAVLRGADLAIAKGQIVGLIGPSGSGKSTLLQIAGLLDNPTSGTIAIAGARAEALDDGGRTRLRRTTVGFVYQFHHLLKEFSAVENVMIPQQLAGKSAAMAKARAQSLLEAVGLGHRLRHRPAKLSGGEQQRVAIARALANRPALLLADEPTGNLDPATAEGVFQLLVSLTRQQGMAALIATHNLDLGARMDRVVRLEQGLLHAG